jgi:2-polyprenyl-6-hydroxyphenyl methylase/3-demethylubiquinone-9 3-methyltransferase
VNDLDAANYHYEESGAAHTAAYLFEPTLREIQKRLSPPGRIFELGCGNGSFAAELAQAGYQVTAIDPSESGIAIAKQSHPEIDFQTASAYDALVERFGTFRVVVSLEVVEHLYAPKVFARAIYEMLEPGGAAILSTPYHGYWKNLALALSGKFDAHFSPLWDHGHIKFWSTRTLRELLEGAGFKKITFERVGRIPSLAKSMIAVAEK